MNTAKSPQPITLTPKLAAILERLQTCADHDGLTLLDLLEGMADDLELQQKEEDE